MHWKELFDGLVNRKRDCLARAITLVESSRPDHQIEANKLLEEIAHKATNKNFQDKYTLRLGIVGPPGRVTVLFMDRLVYNNRHI